jgi:hypothetical protein
MFVTLPYTQYAMQSSAVVNCLQLSIEKIFIFLTLITSLLTQSVSLISGISPEADVFGWSFLSGGSNNYFL